MSSEPITLMDFADAFAAKVNAVDVPDIHPAGVATIFRWLDEMHTAAEDGSAGVVARLARFIVEKVEQERAYG
jgi:hypothetical protein